MDIAHDRCGFLRLQKETRAVLEELRDDEIGVKERRRDEEEDVEQTRAMLDAIAGRFECLDGDLYNGDGTWRR